MAQLKLGWQGDPKLEATRPSRFASATSTPDSAAGPHPFDTAGAQQPVAPFVSS